MFWRNDWVELFEAAVVVSTSAKTTLGQIQQYDASVISLPSLCLRSLVFEHNYNDPMPR